jgi:protein HOOK3
LIQISRFCLSIGVWANGNEKVIKKIQNLDEKVMAELMTSIEGVMDTLPPVDAEDESEVKQEDLVGGRKRVSPMKQAAARLEK